uniref:Uncharacterized protein n=1 Tax=Oryza punctata TaxID=4537 RepID=A0A0E0M770_ORYPU
MGDVSLNPPINAEPLPATICKGDQFLDLTSDGWTNERHSLYISSMEASFMEQLYGNEHHAGGSNGFRVHREGVCDNLRSERNDAHAHDVGMRCFPENPWIRRFRPRDAYVNCKTIGVGFSVDDDESGTDMARQRVRKSLIRIFLTKMSKWIQNHARGGSGLQIPLPHPMTRQHNSSCSIRKITRSDKRLTKAGGAVKTERKIGKLGLESCSTCCGGGGTCAAASPLT